MNNIETLKVDLPQSLEPISIPMQVGPSSFPHNIDQLKTIDYSSSPNDTVLQQKLSRYYQLLSYVAANTASEEDISELQRILIDVRNYVVTEEDFNLMADAVRTTQIYLKNAADANMNNYTALTTLLLEFTEDLNKWVKTLNKNIDAIGMLPSLATEMTYSFGPQQPTKAPKDYDFNYYYWVDTKNNEIKIGDVNSDTKEISNFREVNNLSDPYKNFFLEFTRSADLFKRKTVISLLSDGQAGMTTVGPGQEDHIYLTDYTTDSDFVLEELSIGQNAGSIGNVDDLIDGHFDVGLTPVDMINTKYGAGIYPEEEGTNWQSV